MPQQNVATFTADLADVRSGIRDALADVVDPSALGAAVDEIFIGGRNRVEDELQGLIDDVEREFRKDISIPVDYSTTPETRSKPGEFPRYDKGRFYASIRSTVYRPGPDKIVATTVVDTPYARRLNSHDQGGRFYTELTESKWAPRVWPRLTIALR